MLNIAVTDDDEKTTEYLRDTISDFFEENELSFSIYIFKNGKSLIDSGINFDIVFLDIVMESLDGIETAKQMRKKNRNCALFYVTNYSEYMKASLSVHPFAFIEKPIDKELLLSNLSDYLLYLPVKKEKIHAEFNIDGKVTSIPVSNILYLEYIENRKIQMKTTSGSFILKGSISSYHSRLKNYDFIMPHKGFVVNLSHIKNYFINRIIMSDDYTVPISKKRCKAVEADISDYLHRDF